MTAAVEKNAAGNFQLSDIACRIQCERGEVCGIDGVELDRALKIQRSIVCHLDGGAVCYGDSVEGVERARGSDAPQPPQRATKQRETYEVDGNARPTIGIDLAIVGDGPRQVQHTGCCRYRGAALQRHAIE